MRQNNNYRVPYSILSREIANTHIHLPNIMHQTISHEVNKNKNPSKCDDKIEITMIMTIVYGHWILPFTKIRSLPFKAKKNAIYL